MVKRTSTPLLRLPTTVAEAWEAVRTEVRIKVVKWLYLHPGSTIPQVAEGLGADRSVVTRDLHALEALGAVTADLPAGERKRRKVHWTVNAPRWQELIDQIANFPTDEDNPLISI